MRVLRRVMTACLPLKRPTATAKPRGIPSRVHITVAVPATCREIKTAEKTWLSPLKMSSTALVTASERKVGELNI